MLSSIDLKGKSRKLETKFLELRTSIQSSYDLIKNDTDLPFLGLFAKTPAPAPASVAIDSFFSSIGNSFSSYVIKPRVKVTITFPTLISTESLLNRYHEAFDWMQGRINGPVVRLIISKGVIVEKVLVSPKGRFITINSLQLKLIQRIS